MPFQYSSTIVACLALIASIGSLLYSVKTTRHTKYIQDGTHQRGPRDHAGHH